MLLSAALIILCGFSLGGLLYKLRLPPLLGMIATGLLLGPYCFNLISDSILAISSELRQMALVVILLRAGLALDLEELKKVGRPAILLCFVPATCELLAVAFLAPKLLGISTVDAAVLGAILAAVSPAVVVPRMLRLMESGYGREKAIPQMVIAAASVDDIYVVVLFSALLQMAQGGSFSATQLLQVPASIATGLLAGFICGIFSVWFFKKVHLRDTIKVFLLLAFSFLLLELETVLVGFLPLSGLLAVLMLGCTISRKYPVLAKRLSVKYAKVWVGAELMLFVLVGAAVDIRYIGYAGTGALILIAASLLLRTAGVILSLVGTALNPEERLFVAVSYLPKATVQAAIGGAPLAVGLASGNVILAVSVLTILVTAPLGAIGIDLTYKKLLAK